MAEPAALWQAYATGSLCGLDEAGRGPLAGPVSAGAVILDPARPIAGLADSKVLKPQRREALASLIKQQALAWGHGYVWPEEIEALNIHRASLLAMERAFIHLLEQFPAVREQLRCVVSDGKFCPDLGALVPDLVCCSQVKGDALVAEVSAASIIAKTERDAWMCDYARQDPRYGFEQHMGYPVPAHKEALKLHGPCPIHRQSWVRKFLAP